MLKISKYTRFCSAISGEVTVNCQSVEVGGRKVGPDRVVGCNSKQICKLVYEDEKLAITINWQRCVLNSH